MGGLNGGTTLKEYFEIKFLDSTLIYLFCTHVNVITSCSLVLIDSL